MRARRVARLAVVPSLSIFLLTLLWGMPARAGTAASPAGILAAFNAERTAAGLPAVTQNATWSHDCALHDGWMARNNVLAHQETEGSPGYSDDGNWAGTHSVLARGSSWSDGDPWETAPIHLSQMMSPLLTTVGVDESNGYDCLTTFPGYATPTADPATTAFFPGQGATLPLAETASESPATPGSWVGLPTSTTTGPYLYLYAPGRSGDPDTSDNSCTQDPDTGQCQPGTQSDPTPDALPLSHVTDAVLTGPQGAVDVRTVDPVVAANAGYPGYIPALGLFIPAQPLKPSTSYTLTATVSSDPPPGTAGSDDEVYQPTGPFTVTYAFRTAAASVQAPVRSVAGSKLAVSLPATTAHGHAVILKVAAPGRFTVTVTITDLHRRRLARVVYRSVAGKPGTVWSFRVPVGHTVKGQRVTVAASVSVSGSARPVTSSRVLRFT